MSKIAESTVRRLSLYLRLLEEFEQDRVPTVNSEALAERVGITAAQVRKDLSFFGSFGTRGQGYSVPDLAHRLRQILGLEHTRNVIVVGAGKIGQALLQYRGFRERGFRVLAVYDTDPTKIGQDWGGLTVRNQARLSGDLRERAAEIAVLATPADAAQEVAERLVRGGVKAILNFAPVSLDLPETVTVKNVNMALELETLSYAIQNRERLTA